MGYTPICPVRSNNHDFAQKHQLSITQVPLWEISSISSVKKLFKKYKDACAVISCLSSRKGTKKDSWEVDFSLNMHLLKAAIHSGIINSYTYLQYVFKNQN